MGRPRKPKLPPQTFEEACATETERKTKKKGAAGNVSSVYKGKVMDDEGVEAIVAQLRQEFIEGQENAFANRKDLLNKPHEVFMQINEYLKVCEAVRKPPDMTGLAKKFGITRDTLYAYIRVHPDTESTRLIRMFEDTCTEAMTLCALGNNVNPIVAIFTLKARYGFKEASEVLVTPNNPMGELQSPEDIAAKYSYLPAADQEPFAIDSSVVISEPDYAESTVTESNVIEVIEDVE